MTGWIAVRMIRWPAQSDDRDWCEARNLPRVLLVEEAHPLPEPGPHEVVLPQTAGSSVISAAVDELAAVTPADPAAVSPPGGRRTAGRRPAQRCARRRGG